MISVRKCNVSTKEWKMESVDTKFFSRLFRLYWNEDVPVNAMVSRFDSHSGKMNYSICVILVLDNWASVALSYITIMESGGQSVLVLDPLGSCGSLYLPFYDTIKSGK